MFVKKEKKLLTISDSFSSFQLSELTLQHAKGMGGEGATYIEYNKRIVCIFYIFHVFTVNKFRARIQIKRLYLNCVSSLAIVLIMIIDCYRTNTTLSYEWMNEWTINRIPNNHPERKYGKRIGACILQTHDSQGRDPFIVWWK